MKIFISISFFIISITAFCQDTIITNVIIFDEDDMSKYNSRSKEYAKNAIKFNPLLLINGEIPIYYERALNNKFSAEVAIGMTYRDYMGDLWRAIGDDETFEEENTKINSHIAFKLGFRYYTGGIALDGFYFALEYANRKYSQDVTLSYTLFNNINSSSVTTTYNFTEEQLHNEFKLLCGSQDHSYWDNFFFDYYGGVGIDKRSLINITSNTDPITGENIYSIERITETKPRFYLGIKIGFEF